VVNYFYTQYNANLLEVGERYPLCQGYIKIFKGMKNI
jgi:hypothetical protein